MPRLFSVLLLLLTTACIWLLNQRMGDLPPLGKLLDPINGFWANSEKEGISAPQELILTDLKAPVRIYWDKNLVPQISAQHEHDLYLAQGYVTAYHRLWQMEFQLYKTEGRLSEILGESLFEYDRWQRRKGLRYAAEALCLQVMSNKKTRNMAVAYAKGVNARIKALDYVDYPLEYKLLDYEPEPWSPYKTCLLIKEMSDILSLDDRDIENTVLLSALGPKAFDLIFSDAYPSGDVMVPAEAGFSLPDEALSLPPPNLTDTLRLQHLPSRDHNGQHGSHLFALAKTKSVTNEVLFSASPDLDLNLPSLWYLCGLHTPTSSCMGGTLPGLPGVLVGANDSIAWGLTNAERDLSDWYAITFIDNTRDEYLYNNRPYKTSKRIEKIIVRGSDTYYDTILSTHHGMVVYDRNFGDELPKGVNLARAWIGNSAYAQNDLLIIYALNHATNSEAFMTATSLLSAPSQNFGFASAQGDIGLREHARYPLKWHGQGKFIMDGSQTANDWQGDIPSAHDILLLNPEEGFVSSANERPIDEDLYPYYIYSYNFEYFRGRRLKERLRATPKWRVNDVIKLQYDNFNYIAYDILPMLLDSLSREALSVEESRVYDLLLRWDFFNEAGALAPSYFEHWFDSLEACLWDEIQDIQGPIYMPGDYRTIRVLKSGEAQPFYDIQSTQNKKENLKDLSTLSFKRAFAALEQWKKKNNKAPTWAGVRGTTLRHLLRIEPFSVTDLAIGGNRKIINAVEKHHGPSLRFIASLSEEKQSLWFIYPGGQPGNPGHPSYTRFVNDWVKGVYLSYTFPIDHQKLTKEAQFIQSLLPQ